MKKFILAIAVMAAVITTGAFCYNNYRIAAETRERALRARAASWANLTEEINGAARSYKGTAAIVIKDLDMLWQIGSDKDLPVPSASLVKIPVMMAYFSAEREGRIRFDDVLELKRSDKVNGSGTLKNESPGLKLKIEDLIYLMITRSDNTAANILIDRLGIEEINLYFARLGLKHTNLSRKMMDFKSRREGVENYTTAGDMAYLLEMLYRGRFINKEVSKRCLELLAKQKVNDRIPKELPQDTTVAHKTGLENGVCHDVGIVYTPKGDFLICVLTKHAYTTARLTKRLIARLSLFVYNYYGGL